MKKRRTFRRFLKIWGWVAITIAALVGCYLALTAVVWNNHPAVALPVAFVVLTTAVAAYLHFTSSPDYD